VDRSLRLTWSVSLYPLSIPLYGLLQVSGTRYLSSFPLLHALSPSSQLFTGAKLLADGAPFYGVYACKDGEFISVGCLEPQFFKAFIDRFVCEIEGGKKRAEWIPSTETQTHLPDWPKLKQYLTDGFKSRNRDYWGQLFHGTDACIVPVLSPTEASSLAASSLPIPHPHLMRTSPRSLQFLPQASAAVQASFHLSPGQHTDDVLRELGVTAKERNRMIKDGALGAMVETKL